MPAHTATLILLVALLTACGGAQQRADEAAKRGAQLEKSGQLPEAALAFDEAAEADPETPARWLAAARGRARLGQWPAAEERARRALTLKPDDPAAADALARVQMTRGDMKAAAETYAALLSARPEAATGWFGQGRVAELRGDAEGAEASYVRATTLDPKLAEAWEMLGALRLRSRRQAAAARAFNKAVEADPRRRALDPRILDLALEGGDREVARAAAQRLAGADASEGQGSLAVAAMLARRDDYLGAANELEWLLERRPENSQARLMLARVLLQVERGAQARTHLEEIPADSPDHVEALRLRGLSLVADGQPKAGVPLLAQAIEADPKRPELVRDLGRAQASAGRLPEAVATLEAGVRRFPRSVPLLYQLGIALTESGDDARAVAQMRRLLALNPDHSGALNFIGFTWAEQGVRLKEAEQLILRALEQRPNDGAIIDSLGWLFFRQGRLEEAKRTLRLSLTKMPGEAEVQFHLAEVLWAMGEKEEAMGLYQAAIGAEKDATRRRRYEARVKALPRVRPKRRRPRR
jgi:tetratricopeptide (TPR) repeat protein